MAKSKWGNGGGHKFSNSYGSGKWKNGKAATSGATAVTPGGMAATTVVGATAVVVGATAAVPGATAAADSSTGDQFVERLGPTSTGSGPSVLWWCNPPRCAISIAPTAICLIGRRNGSSISSCCLYWCSASSRAPTQAPSFRWCGTPANPSRLPTGWYDEATVILQCSLAERRCRRSWSSPSTCRPTPR